MIVCTPESVLFAAVTVIVLLAAPEIDAGLNEIVPFPVDPQMKGLDPVSESEQVRFTLPLKPLRFVKLIVAVTWFPPFTLRLAGFDMTPKSEILNALLVAEARVPLVAISV